jgi:DNA end-binding protein Ku
MFPATSTEGTIAFRMIHEPSGKPINNLKGIQTKHGFEEVPEEEIIKGYEHTRGHHVLIKQEELDALKLEAKHTIDMTTFVDLDEIDSRYFEKPYYLLPDGDEADEGYVVLRDALAKSKKMAVGQLIMRGREHIVGIMAHKKGLLLVNLRYADELRKPEPYFDKLDAEPKPDAVKLAVNVIEKNSGKFEPQKMPNEYTHAVHELVRAKIEQRAPQVEIETGKREAPKVVNIMDALKKGMQARGEAKVRDSVRRRMGKEPAHKKPARASKSAKPSAGAGRSLH